MLPFLKEESIGQSSDEHKDYGVLDAIAEDLLMAFEKKDKAMIKSAIDSLCEYIKEEDIEQDQSLTNKE